MRAEVHDLHVLWGEAQPVCNEDKHRSAVSHQDGRGTVRHQRIEEPARPRIKLALRLAPGPRTLIKSHRAGRTWPTPLDFRGRQTRRLPVVELPELRFEHHLRPEGVCNVPGRVLRSQQVTAEQPHR